MKTPLSFPSLGGAPSRQSVGLLSKFLFLLVIPLQSIQANTPFLIEDIDNHGYSYSSEPHDFVVVHNNLYFNAYTKNGRKVFCYNGTETTPVVESDRPASLADETFGFDDKLYFGAATESHRHPVLWEYDGENPARPLYEKFNKEGGFDFPSTFCAFKGKLYFSTSTNDSRDQLWAYDGVNEPELVATMPEIDGMIEFQSELLISRRNDGAHQFWSYDGSKEPKLKHSMRFADRLLDIPYQGFKVFGNKVYFSARTRFFYSRSPQQAYTNLMVYDGINPPQQISDIQDQSIHRSNTTEYELPLIELKGELYTVAKDEVSARGNKDVFFIWKIQGEDQPVQVHRFEDSRQRGIHETSLKSVIGYDDKMYIDTEHHNGGLFVFDGSQVELKLGEWEDTYRYRNVGLSVAYKGKIYGNIDASFYNKGKPDERFVGNELGSYDPGANEMVLVEDVYPRTNDASPHNFVRFKGSNYFVTNKGFQNFYKIDDVTLGQETGTPSLITNRLDFGNSFTYGVEQTIVFQDQLIVSAVASVSIPDQLERERRQILLAWDGENEPLHLNADWNNLQFGSLRDFTVCGNTLYFTAWGSEYENYGLWAYDGNNEPVLVASAKDEQHEANVQLPFTRRSRWGVDPQYLGCFQEKLYFQGQEAAVGENQEDNTLHGLELYVTDGTHTSLAADVVPGNQGAAPHDFVAFQDRLYFTAQNNEGEEMIWVYDSENGAQKAFDKTESGYDFQEPATVFNNELILKVASSDPDAPSTVNQLYTYNGIEAPQLFVDKDETVGLINEAQTFYVHNNKLYFTVKNSADRAKPFVHDGQNLRPLFEEEGTDLHVNTFYGTGECLMFNAEDDILNTGEELWGWCPEEPCPEENRVSSLDVNGDGHMSIFDLYPLIEKMGTFCTPGWCVREGDDPACYCDFNGDGGVSIFDFYYFAKYFGEPADVYNPWEAHLGKTDITAGELVLDVNETKRNADGSVTAPLYFSEQVALAPVKALAMAFQTVSKDALQQVTLTYNTDKFGALNNGHAALEHFDASSQIMQSGIAFVGDQTTTGAGMIGTLTFTPAKGTGDFNIGDIDITAFEAYAYDALGNQMPLRLAKRAGLSIEENQEVISLWHDAASQQLVINGLLQHDAVQIQVMSLTGMSILESTLTGSSVDLSTLPAGQYMVTLAGSSPAKTQIERLTVVR